MKRHEHTLPRMVVEGMVINGCIENHQVSGPIPDTLYECPITGNTIQPYTGVTRRCKIAVDAIYILKNKLVNAITHANNPSCILREAWAVRTKICMLCLWLFKYHHAYGDAVLTQLGVPCSDVMGAHIGKSCTYNVTWNDLIWIELGHPMKQYVCEMSSFLK